MKWSISHFFVNKQPRNFIIKISKKSRIVFCVFKTTIQVSTSKFENSSGMRHILQSPTDAAIVLSFSQLFSAERTIKLKIKNEKNMKGVYWKMTNWVDELKLKNRD